jgi:hypothetical protein
MGACAAQTLYLFKMLAAMYYGTTWHKWLGSRLLIAASFRAIFDEKGQKTAFERQKVTFYMTHRQNVTHFLKRDTSPVLVKVPVTGLVLGLARDRKALH